MRNFVASWSHSSSTLPSAPQGALSRRGSHAPAAHSQRSAHITQRKSIREAKAPASDTPRSHSIPAPVLSTADARRRQYV